MKKEEYIKKYGLDAYNRKAEANRLRTREWYKSHKEQHSNANKQWNRKHKVYKRNYMRNYGQMFAFVISNEKDKIENYQLALNDDFKGWQIHHRLETHTSDGIKRLHSLSVKELKALDMYYNRPAKELIFLKVSDHTSLHASCR